MMFKPGSTKFVDYDEDKYKTGWYWYKKPSSTIDPDPEWEPMKINANGVYPFVEFPRQNNLVYDLLSWGAEIGDRIPYPGELCPPDTR